MKNRAKYFFAALISASILLTPAGCINQEDRQSGPAIMAYYVPGGNYKPADIPVEKLTHIIFSFTEVIDNEMAFKNDSYSIKLEELVKQKERNPELKVMIACGGWGGSGGFSDMASTPESMDRFIESTIAFINKYDLDGVDIDWEYPGMRGAGNPYRPEDRENFTALMKGLREAFDKSEKKLILTFASAGWERYYDHIEPGEVMKYADYMNIMTYDLIGGGSPFTGHHTNLGRVSLTDMEGTPYYNFILEREKEAGDQGYKYTARGADAIVPFCINLGIDPAQIVIGGAFYGRAWKGVTPDNNGLYQSNRGVYIGWAGYSEIRDKFENKNGYVRFWDPVAKAPFLYNSTDSIFISYDDTVSLRLKTRYCLDNNLGGIMFWELGTDTKDKSGLLDAIFKASGL